MSDADDQLGSTGGPHGRPPQETVPGRDNAAPVTPEEASEAATEGEEQVRQTPKGPGAPMQHGENR